MRHRSALPSHYDAESEHYDAFNDKNSEADNRVLERLLRRHGIRTVLDLTCGTGSQVFWLARRGFRVVGVDLSARMLARARRKARAFGRPVVLRRGDMRTSRVGAFDAVITWSSSIGHLTRADFEKAIGNIRDNLKSGGLYVFDIFNRSFLSRDGKITRLTIDWERKVRGGTVRYIQYSTQEGDGVMASHTTTLERRGSAVPRVARSVQTMQLYTPAELRSLLRRNGFAVVRQCGASGARLTPATERILTIARKR